jgi:hypothetical protein
MRRTLMSAGLPAILVTVAIVAVPTASADLRAGSRATATASCALPTFGPGSRYRPQIRASDFTANVTNQWFPLTPGKILVYTGEKNGIPGIDIVTATRRTRVIDGVSTRVVADRAYGNGFLGERTSDYYAQDRCGNVWYFGEDTAELNRQGKVTSRSGSFHAGIHRAQPGVFLQAHPQIGRAFRQEWSPGQAEDQYRALDFTSSTTVPFGRFHGLLRTEETTALEPGVLDNKYYLKGVGTLLETTVKGGNETFRLSEIISGA